MDPVSPVAQLAVATISGAAFLVSMLVIPFPDSKADSSAGITAPSQTTSTTSPSFGGTISPLTK